MFIPLYLQLPALGLDRLPIFVHRGLLALSTMHQLTACVGTNQVRCWAIECALLKKFCKADISWSISLVPLSIRNDIVVAFRAAVHC